jgi:hypothetical protein
MIRKLLVALALSLLALVAAKAGTERVDLSNTVKVLVFSTDKEGHWTSRVGVTAAFTDAVIIACFEWPASAVVQCFVIVKKTGETLLMPLRLKEIKA